MCLVTYLCLQYWTLDYGQLFWLCILITHIHSAYFSIFSYSSIRSLIPFLFSVDTWLYRWNLKHVQMEVNNPGTNCLYSGQHSSFGYSPASIKNKNKSHHYHHYHQSSRITLFFWQPSRIYWWAQVRVDKTKKLSGVQGLLDAQAAMIRDVFDPQPSETGCFSITVFQIHLH